MSWSNVLWKASRLQFVIWVELITKQIFDSDLQFGMLTLPPLGSSNSLSSQIPVWTLYLFSAQFVPSSWNFLIRFLGQKPTIWSLFTTLYCLPICKFVNTCFPFLQLFNHANCPICCITFISITPVGYCRFHLRPVNVLPSASCQCLTLISIYLPPHL